MNRLQTDMKKGLFAEAEKAWDNNKAKLGVKTGQPAEMGGQSKPTAPAQPAAPPVAPPAPPAAPPAPPAAPPAPPASSAAPPVPGASTAVLSDGTPQAGGLPTQAYAAHEPYGQPAPTPTNSQVDGAPAEQPQEKQKLTAKLKDKLMAKINDPKVQDKAEQVLKKEAKKKLFGFRF